VKVGDLVKIIKVSRPGIGVLIEKRILQSEYRFDVLCEDGKIAKGLAGTYLEVISESR
jgi:hypothetical protein